MNPTPKKGSSLIRNYIAASQQIDLDMEAARLARLKQISDQREGSNKKAVKETSRDTSKDSIKDLDHHKIPWTSLCQRFSIDEKTIFTTGLTKDDAAQRNLKEGDNMLTERVKNPWWLKLINEWTSPFACLLWAGSLLCFIAYALDTSDPSNVYLGIVLALVVIVTGLITFLQNSKSDSVMEGFKNFIPQKCTVIRDGVPQAIFASKIVRGDIVLLETGAKVPADIRIIEAKDLRVDNSSLTGESDPLLRSPECTEPEKILETKNVVFFGTMIKEGRGKGMVFNISDATVIGQIASLADAAGVSITPLRRELNRFINIITVIALVLGILFFCLGFLLKYTVLQNLVFAIGIIVANVPEGLLATITITLSLTSIKMQAKKVLVKNLESVETLGSATCICSDKTGTLTQNKMTIENIFYDGQVFKGANKEKMGPKFQYAYDSASEGFRNLHHCAIVGSEAFFSNALGDKYQGRIDALDKNSSHYDADRKKIEAEWDEHYKSLPYYEKPVKGDASETAIVKFFQPIEDILVTRNRYPMGVQKDGATSQVPFNSAHKFALKVVRHQAEGSHWVAYLKGAPERVWDKCSHVFYRGREIILDRQQRKLIEDANTLFAKGGQRCLGFAKYHLPASLYKPDHKFEFKSAYELDIPLDKFCFVGLVSLIDPPRDAVPDAIKKCKTAGIKVIMVTGDQQLTAAAIAKQIGIFEAETSVEYQERTGCNYEEAIEKCRAIVVNGDMLSAAYQEDEGLPESKKGKKLEKWLLKPQIVFARTSPAQKLYIVKGCQKLGYITAVTGDGVNDSPAINQADIGIAMGIAGSDVAKDSADMILLNDDFSAIILGIEEGRKIFDNLKKSISYTITSNIPEIFPYLAFIILQIPLPLSTVLMLCVDLGTDMVPAVSFSYEESELDIMTRKPREKDEHLVTAKLMMISYGQLGFLQTAGGFICYCVAMYDYGMNVSSLFGVILKDYYPHNGTDVYDPNHPFFGNTNVKLVTEGSTTSLRLINSDVAGAKNSDFDDGPRLVDWLYTLHLEQDLRLGYIALNSDNKTVSMNVDWSPCKEFHISPVSFRPVCYSTEALKYAQTSFFTGVVCVQFFNSWCYKTRKISLRDQGLKNMQMIFGWVSEFSLCLCLCYIRPINIVFGTRDLLFGHYFIPAVPAGLMMVFWEECRKWFIRNYPQDDEKLPNWFERNICY